MAFYQAFGAAKEVTGSCHHLQIGQIQILVDCGMFQGKEEELNFEDFGFDPSKIDFLILTHAHLDHIGRVPLLVKKGFKGKIVCTKATHEIASLMLNNSGAILEKEQKVLYTQLDAKKSLEYFGLHLEADGKMCITDDIKLLFKNAGHILGAVSVKIKFVENGEKKSVIFSGDLGDKNRIITAPVQTWNKANYIFIESTYGSSLHKDLNISIQEFKDMILKTISKNGTVIIPSFALERTQEILFLLRSLSCEKKINNIPVFLDSPLAINVTKKFLNYPNLFSYDVGKVLLEDENPFDFKELVHTYAKEDSMKINSIKGAKIVIAGSGMCEGGRVGYHLQRYLSDPNNLVLFVGYQVSGTLGRKICSEKKDIKIKGADIIKRANIKHIDGFSAHADQNSLIDWIEHVKGLDCVYLIHGDEPKLEKLKDKVKNKLKQKVHIVKMKEKIFL